MPYNGERELLSPPPGHHMEGKGCYLKVKNSDPELFLFKRTAQRKD